MKYKITRRDFLNGVAIGTGAGLLAPLEVFAQVTSGTSSDYYPPTLTGMRGNHPGAFEVSHDLAWSGVKPAEHRNLDEHYDMVIVGAGVSGLAAARFYQKRMGPDAKILLLDNHDDFGGHAKRNEFHHDGQTLLGIGGSVNMEGPGETTARYQRASWTISASTSRPWLPTWPISNSWIQALLRCWRFPARMAT